MTLLSLIQSPDPAIRNQSLDAVCAALSARDLLAECHVLDQFRRQAENLYERVRALFFLYSLHRFHLPRHEELRGAAHIPLEGHHLLLRRRFEEALDVFLAQQQQKGPSDALSSALATGYHRLAFQTLADQVRRSVRSVRGNQWMFRMGHPADHPLRIRPELLTLENGVRPILRERTPVRMDLTHSAWSDIFFLGMDYPEGARVLNVSVDLGVNGRDAAPSPPVEAYLRVLDEPVLRLTSVDLNTSADLVSLAEVFDFAKDYLGLLKAAVIAAGIVPPGIEGSMHDLPELLERLVGPGRGLELVSSVNNIPKGSRLAVSTNLLAALISVCMRATGQAESLTGPLREEERRLVLARALLGEWLGGSGGGWQDSGGVWPGIKLIEGVLAREGDAEFGVSRGCLMPRHRILDHEEVSNAARQALQDSLVLVHGGMAQNVGPILEMVTEKYLLRSAAEWRGREQALEVMEEVLQSLRAGDIPALGRATTGNFEGPIQTIIPWASTFYTEQLIAKARAAFGEDFHGFWMLGGMSGGGMGFMVAPHRKAEAQHKLREIMAETKHELRHALPFAMEPVVYDFAINEHGTSADLRSAALMPEGYYRLVLPHLLRKTRAELPRSRRAELDLVAEACRSQQGFGNLMRSMFDHLLPQPASGENGGAKLADLLRENGFDEEQHGQIRAGLLAGRIGLSQNRLPASTKIEDVRPGDVIDFIHEKPNYMAEADGKAALERGELAIVTLAAGAGSRWTQGAGVVKALYPFSKFAGRHRNFIEVALAKSRRSGRLAGGTWQPHIFTTSYLTHEPIADYLRQADHYHYEGPLRLSPGRAIGLRMTPMARDLRFLWEEMPQQQLDERQEKMRDSLRDALLNWAKTSGEGSDYTDNLPSQCLHPVGHWFEIPNLLRNGTLLDLLKERPGLKYLLVHNLDTMGAHADPALLGAFMRTGATLAYEVIPRRLDDRGGGLARVNGQPRLVEGLAMAREEDEFQLSYYNTLTTWVDIDRLLALFELTRDQLADPVKVTAAVRALAARMPTYLTLKDVKKRWGHGQEDVFPVSQFEKLWGDMSSLPKANCRFFVVSRFRGQQLKDQAQLDGWLRDGSAAYVENLCAFD